MFLLAFPLSGSCDQWWPKIYLSNQCAKWHLPLIFLSSNSRKPLVTVISCSSVSALKFVTAGSQCLSIFDSKFFTFAPEHFITTIKNLKIHRSLPFLEYSSNIRYQFHFATWCECKYCCVFWRMIIEVIDHIVFDSSWRFSSQVQLHCFPKGRFTQIGFYKSRDWARRSTDAWTSVTDRTFRPPHSGKQREYELTLTMDSSLIQQLTLENYVIFCGITGRHGSTTAMYKFEFPNHEIDVVGGF